MSKSLSLVIQRNKKPAPMSETEVSKDGSAKKKISLKSKVVVRKAGTGPPPKVTTNQDTSYTHKLSKADGEKKKVVSTSNEKQKNPEKKVKVPVDSAKMQSKKHPSSRQVVLKTTRAKDKESASSASKEETPSSPVIQANAVQKSASTQKSPKTPKSSSKDKEVQGLTQTPKGKHPTTRRVASFEYGDLVPGGAVCSVTTIVVLVNRFLRLERSHENEHGEIITRFFSKEKRTKERFCVSYLVIDGKIRSTIDFDSEGKEVRLTGSFGSNVSATVQSAYDQYFKDFVNKGKKESDDGYVSPRGYRWEQGDSEVAWVEEKKILPKPDARRENFIEYTNMCLERYNKASSLRGPRPRKKKVAEENPTSSKTSGVKRKADAIEDKSPSPSSKSGSKKTMRNESESRTPPQKRSKKIESSDDFISESRGEVELSQAEASSSTFRRYFLDFSKSFYLLEARVDDEAKKLEGDMSAKSLRVDEIYSEKRGLETKVENLEKEVKKARDEISSLKKELKLAHNAIKDGLDTSDSSASEDLDYEEGGSSEEEAEDVGDIDDEEQEQDDGENDCEKDDVEDESDPDSDNDDESQADEGMNGEVESNEETLITDENEKGTRVVEEEKHEGEESVEEDSKMEEEVSEIQGEEEDEDSDEEADADDILGGDDPEMMLDEDENAGEEEEEEEDALEMNDVDE